MKNVHLLLFTLLALVGLVASETLIKICSSSEFKALQADICSSLFKRGRFSKIIFNSHGYHKHGRAKRSANGNHIDLPRHCCDNGCPRTYYALMGCDSV